MQVDEKPGAAPTLLGAAHPAAAGANQRQGQVNEGIVKELPNLHQALAATIPFQSPLVRPSSF